MRRDADQEISVASDRDPPVAARELAGLGRCEEGDVV